MTAKKSHRIPNGAKVCPVCGMSREHVGKREHHVSEMGGKSYLFQHLRTMSQDRNINFTLISDLHAIAAIKSNGPDFIIIRKQT